MMRILFFLLVMVMSNALVAQVELPKMDTVESLFFYSDSYTIDKSFLPKFKRRKDVGMILNLCDDDIFIFHDGWCHYYGKINDFQIDSTGKMDVDFRVLFEYSVGDTDYDACLNYNVGGNDFTLHIKDKTSRHGNVVFRFQKEKTFNLDF